VVALEAALVAEVAAAFLEAKASDALVVAVDA